MKITVSRLSGKEIEISSKTDISELDSIKFEDLFWVDVEDFNQEFLNYMEKRFSIDPLTVEDINSGKQRVKTEENCVSGSKKYWKFGNTIGSGYTTI